MLQHIIRLFFLVTLFTQIIYCLECKNKTIFKCIKVKEFKEPYYKQVCNITHSCKEDKIKCGDDDLFCAPNEQCVLDDSCAKNTKTDFDDNPSNDSPISSSKCYDTYFCETKMPWEMDRKESKVECTEHYKLKRGENCETLYEKFYLEKKALLFLNENLDCDNIHKHTNLCVHANIEPNRKKCGKLSCEPNFICETNKTCEYIPNKGDQCDDIKCEKGYACKKEIHEICHEPEPEPERIMSVNYVPFQSLAFVNTNNKLKDDIELDEDLIGSSIAEDYDDFFESDFKINKNNYNNKDIFGKNFINIFKEPYVSQTTESKINSDKESEEKLNSKKLKTKKKVNKEEEEEAVIVAQTPMAFWNTEGNFLFSDKFHIDMGNP